MASRAYGRGFLSFGRCAAGILGCVLALVACSPKQDDAAVGTNHQELGTTPATWPSEGPQPIKSPSQAETLPLVFGGDATGAVERIVIDPTNPTGAYAASVNGGVFKTADYTTILSATPTRPTWVTTTDQLPSLSLGDLAIDPLDSQRIATGAGCTTAGGLCGVDGLFYLSTEGGDSPDSWDVTNDPLFYGQKIQGITVRGQTILVATGAWAGAGGIYRRRSDAAAFESRAGQGGLPASFGAVYDLIADPTDANAYYAVIASNGAGNGGVYRTPDAGTTWARVSDNDTNPKGLNFVLNQYAPPVPPATFPPENYVTNARLATAPTGELFVVVALLGQAAYIAHTSDQGVSWAAMDVPSALAGASTVPPAGERPVASISRVANQEEIVVDCSTDHLVPEVATGFHIRLSGVPDFDGEDLNGNWRVEVVSPKQLRLIDRLTGVQGTGATSGSDVSVSGGTWLLWQGSNLGNQAGVHLALTVDPGTPERIYLGGDASDIFVARGDHRLPADEIPSAQWTSLAGPGNTANTTRPHVDVRHLVLDPAGRLLAATDGGAYLRTLPTSASGDWYSLAGNMVTAEMLTVAIDRVSNAILGGTQDNGTPASDGPMTGAPQEWTQIETADGRGVAAVDAQMTDPDTGRALSYRYSTWQGETDFRRHVFDSTGTVVPPPPPPPPAPALPYVILELVTDPNTTPPTVLADVDDVSWMETLVTNPFDPDRLLIGGKEQGIWESVTRGDTVTLVPGSPLAATSIAAGVESNPEAMWAVGSTGLDANGNRLPAGVYQRFAAGGMTQVTAFPGVAPYAVAMAPSNPQVAYVTTWGGGVFGTPNGGADWPEVTGDLTRTTDGVHTGARYLRDVVYIESPGSGDRIVVAAAAGALGVYMMAVDNPGVWMRVGDNLPRAPVTALDYNPDTDTLVAATSGRGAWSIADATQLDRAPQALCQDVIVSADAMCLASAAASDFDAGSFDPEGDPLSFEAVDPSTLQPVSVGPLGLGDWPVTVKVTDSDGAAALCSSVIFRVEDTTPPVLTVPADVQVTSCFTNETVTVGQATATDNCAQNLVPSGQVISKNGAPLSPPLPVVGGQVELGLGSYVVEWTVGDGWNPPVTATQTVTVGAAIVANGTYAVRDRAEVMDEAGNPAAVLNAGSGPTSIGGDGATVGGIIAGGSVIVAWEGYVYGDITAVGTVQVSDPSTHSGSIISVPSVSLPAAPALPSFPPPTGGDVWVNPGDDVSIPPGSYGQIGVNGNPNQLAVLRFFAGDYFFTNLYFNSAGVVVVGEPGTRIYVSGNVTFNASIVSAVGSSELAPVLLGVSGQGYLALYAPFSGTVVAPERNLVLGTGSGLTFTGSFYAAGIELTPDSVLVCSPGVITPASCSDGVQNFSETDVDCGGPDCAACGDGLGCVQADDCMSQVCQGGVCQAPSCSDGVQNGTETGTDCGGPCPPCPVVCNEGTYQAENMFHSTGGPWWQGGWNIYANGYIATTHDFSPGPAIITVSALGQEAWGLPHMLVTVGGVPASPASGVYVTPGGFNAYQFTFDAPGGSQEIRVIFDNDAYYGWFGDRNLIVQTVTVSCP